MAIFGGGGLSVRVSARTGDFERGMDSAQSELSQFGATATSVLAPLQALQGRADEAGDEIADVGRESAQASAGLFSLSGAAGGATGAMTSLTLGTEGAGFSMRSLSGTIILTLIPALGVLAATLAPIIAALGGFVAIGAAVAGIGMVGTLAAISERTEQLRQFFEPLVATLRDAFAPAIDAAARVLIGLMTDFRRVIPALVPTEGVVNDIAVAFRNFGKVLIESLPAFVDLATTLVTQFLPPFTRWLEDILPRIPGMIQGLVSAMERMLPRFMEAGRLLADMAPALLEFGFTALNVVGPALGNLTAALTSALETFNQLSGGVQNLITKSILLAPVLTTLVSLLGGISAPVLAVIGAIGLLWQAWHTNFGNIQGIVQRTWEQLQSALGENLPTLIENVKTILDAILPVLEPIFNAVIDIVGTNLVMAFDSLVSLLTAISEILTGDFAGAWETIEGLFQRNIERITELINRLTGGAFQFAVNQLIEFLNGLGTSLEQFLSMIGLGGTLDFQPISPVDFGGDQGRRPPALQQRGPENGGMGTINIEVTGDTGVIEDVAADVTFEEFQARQARLRRRGIRGG